MSKRHRRSLGATIAPAVLALFAARRRLILAKIQAGQALTAMLRAGQASRNWLGTRRAFLSFAASIEGTTPRPRCGND